MFLFFFSSRRRHTRFDCDWSSDVCSSDLFPLGSSARQTCARTAAQLFFATARTDLLARAAHHHAEMKGIYRCWAEIDRSALRHNAKIVRERVGSAEVLAVVKANAYGHGLMGVAETLAGEAQLFGVANLEEALALRESFSHPIRSEEHTSELQSQSN